MTDKAKQTKIKAETERDSTFLVWKHGPDDPMESERFWWEPWTWDIAKAKHILESNPHPIVEHGIADMVALLSIIEATESQIRDTDLSFPIIVGWKDGEMLVIDGWHRIARAALQGITALPALILTRDENESIINATADFDNDDQDDDWQ